MLFLLTTISLHVFNLYHPNLIWHVQGQVLQCLVSEYLHVCFTQEDLRFAIWVTCLSCVTNV